MTDQQDTINDNYSGYNSAERFTILIIFHFKFSVLPVHENCHSSKEFHEDADILITIDSDREGKEHDSNDGQVGHTVQPNQLVHEIPFLELGPDHDHDVDNEDDRVGGNDNRPVF